MGCVFISGRKSSVFVLGESHASCVIVLRRTPRKPVTDLGIQAKCCYAMPAPSGNIRDSCVSTLSSNIGADKSVTVPATASRMRVKRDMIDEVMCREFVSDAVGRGGTGVGPRE